MSEIKDSVAVITGGVGKSLATYWAKQGGKVVIADVSAEALMKAGAEIEPSGGKVAAVV